MCAKFVLISNSGILPFFNVKRKKIKGFLWTGRKIAEIAKL